MSTYSITFLNGYFYYKNCNLSFKNKPTDYKNRQNFLGLGKEHVATVLHSGSFPGFPSHILSMHVSLSKLSEGMTKRTC